MAETDQKLLEQRVRRETIVDGRLDGHDRRLSSINGQIERGAKATELVAERLQTLTNSVVDLRSEVHAKAEVDLAVRDARIDWRAFIFSVIGAVLMASVVIAAFLGLH